MQLACLRADESLRDEKVLYARLQGTQDTLARGVGSLPSPHTRVSGKRSSTDLDEDKRLRFWAGSSNALPHSCSRAQKNARDPDKRLENTREV